METLLKVESVEWKEAAEGGAVGTLEVLKDSVLWRGGGQSSHQQLSKVKGQKVSPDGKRKVMLQLTFLDDTPAHTFIFLSTQGQAKQTQERNAVKELLLQLLPQHRSKAAATAAAEAPAPASSSKATNASPSQKNEFRKKAHEERQAAKQKLLKEDKSLFRLYQELVGKAVMTAGEFWAEVAAERLGEEEAGAQAVGVPPGFLSDVTKMDGCNGLRLNLTPDIIQAIFKTYPAVKRKHLQAVPHEMDEKDFWTKFFQSHYFHRDRSLNSSPADLFADCVKTDETDMAVEAERDALGSRLCDLQRIQEKSFVDDDEEETAKRRGDPSNHALVRRFNYHSTRVLAASLHSSIATVSLPSTSATAAPLESAELATTPSALPPTLKLQNVDSFAPRASEEASLSRKDVQRQRGSLKRAMTAPKDQIEEVEAGWDQASLTLLEVEVNREATEWRDPSRELPKAREDELGMAYAALNELLRHFWTAFPANTPQLQEKVQRFGNTLRNFKSSRLKPLEASLTQLQPSQIHLMSPMYGMLERAEKKLTAWTEKHVAAPPKAKRPKAQ